jgi:glutamate--cysteine ligase regulatory subunit
VKLFFLPGADVDARPRYTRDAVKLVCKELGVQDIDLLIVSFPGMAFEGDCEWEADRRNSIQGDDEEEIRSWTTLEELHNEGTVKRLGISEFGSEKLSRFLSRVKVRPEVDQVNVRDCCNVPPPLLKLAKAENIELYTHYDCSDILPGGTLRELLGQGENGAGVLSDDRKRGISEDGEEGRMKGDIQPEWVVKYTAVVSDRGVIENKGYFASAQLNE